jgi:hypothetical protein
MSQFIHCFHRILLAAGLAVSLSAAATSVLAYPPGSFPPPESVERFTAQPAHDGQTPRPTVVANGRDCRPQLDQNRSVDTRILTRRGYNDNSCCGASRRCEGLPASCFTPGTQEYECYRHDGCLVGHDASNLLDPVSSRCHRELADRSPDPAIGTFMRGLYGAGRFAQAGDAGARAAVQAVPFANASVYGGDARVAGHAVSVPRTPAISVPEPQLPPLRPRQPGVASQTAALNFVP